MRTPTPGPWNRGIAQNVYQGASWDPHRRQRLIATCEPSTRTQADWEETWANAQLIAAAPDLLAALKAIIGDQSVDRYGYFAARNAMDDDKRAAARAAIAKAIGGPA